MARSESGGIVFLSANAAELDLVCNECVLAERQKPAEKLSYGIAHGSRTTMLTLLLFVVGLGALGMSASTSTCPPILMLLLPFLFLYILLQVIECKGFPTNVRVSDEGISFAWRTNKYINSSPIAWKAIELVESSAGRALVDQPLAGVRLAIVVKTSRLPYANPGKIRRLRNHLAGLATSAWPTEIIQLEFPLDALTLDADKYRLVSAIKEKAPAWALGPNFLRLSEASDAPTFTQLWLDDMQSFRRQRVSELESGATLQDGRYRIVAQLATGGQARIYRGVDVVSNLEVAIKELVLPTTAGADVRNRAFANVRTEAMLLGRLNHPGIVKLLDNFVEDHRAYLVLEQVSGTTLRALIKDSAPLPFAEVVQIGRSMCSFLEYLHSQSPPVIHRDLTPDNVMYSREHGVKLLDFNVARLLESSSTKTVVGKHNYMSPEQFRGQPTTQSDLYSLGCTLYYLITGEDPVPLSCSHPSTRRADTPPALDDVVARLTQLDLAQRYQSAAQAQSDLESG